MGTFLPFLASVALAAPEPSETAPEPSAAAPDAPQAQQITPPRLLDPLPAAWPDGAPSDVDRASVRLALDIDAAGAVTGARVVTSGGAAFDALALAGVSGLRFAPALDHTGSEIPVSIDFNWTFTRTAVITRMLEGRVTDDAGTPLAGAELRLVGPGGATVTVRTGPDGTFSVEELAPGQWLAAALAPGHVAQTASVTVTPGTVPSITFALPVDTSAEQVQGRDELDIVRERTPPEITERVLDADEIRYLPGTNGDVVRVVQNLPGVARPPLNVGQLIIRGTSPEDSAYFLDGGGIPIVFHFAGLSTVVNGDLLSEVAFLPGNFGVRYGRVLGGLVDIRSDAELPDDPLSGYLAVDVYQTTAFAQAKVGKNTAVTLSARRSYIDAVLNPIFAAMGGASVRAPRYYDVQARVLHVSPTLGTMDAMLVVSDDQFRILGEEDEDVFSLLTRFQKLRLRWAQDLPDGWSSETVVVGGPQDDSFLVGDAGEAWERPVLVNARQEFVRPAMADEVLAWRIGADLLGGVDRFKYDVDFFGDAEAGDTPLFAPALYVEPTANIGIAHVSPGLRMDALLLEDYAKVSWDPRIAAKFDVAPGTVIKASTGRYSQFPTTRQITPAGDGNPDLTESWAGQHSLGVEQQLPFFLSLEATAFYNRLHDLVVGREDRFRFFTGPPPQGPFDTEPYANEGSGRVCGVEALLKLEAPTTTGLLAITASNSNRTNRAGETSLFVYDQPLVLNALVSQELPKKWRVGARARFGSGNPYTPVINRVYDMDSRSFFPVYGENGSGRLPNFWSVDLRVDKAYEFKHWTLTAYLDLQNAFNTQNAEVMSWTYDYRAEDPITGLPVLPAFGLKGEL